ncbi:MAG TPA: endonuclease/exonuclease/phosphatase family protein [Actinophytocola sp.]|uniref:endonuclease/exonuclease/phosphatase family protein n=1 Tax=Actinophytocola sp. TaxID=1872138 RepID=UPI002DBF4799|nr:endonuclease/exonuclease/phosphatase family protein [Actinophytocola sp.]HEU5474432.1 endonuclease/exonuclease/phosphatase family protein [Actinophytocola sp.]
MGRRIALLLLTSCLVLTGTGAAQARPFASIRVLTFNMHTGIGEDGRLDLARTAAAIRDSGADVVGLQEVDVHWAARSEFRDQAAELAALLGMRVFFAPIYDLPPLTEGAPARRYGVAVLSRFPILHTENHLITRLSTQDPEPVPLPMPGFAEAVVLARGVPVHVYVTHLDFRPDPAVRAAQVADTVRILAGDRRGARQVLLGDFNAEPAAPELTPLFAAVRDTWSGADPGLTYPAGTPVKRIDYVTATPNLRARDRAVIDTGASDHRAVRVTLRI